MLHAGAAKKFYRAREIWWCAMGINVGFEQDGTGRRFDRPVVIVKGFSRDAFLGTALVGRKKVGQYCFPLGIIENREASVILSQTRLFDSGRLIKRITILDEETFEKLKSALQKALFD